MYFNCVAEIVGNTIWCESSSVDMGCRLMHLIESEHQDIECVEWMLAFYIYILKKAVTITSKLDYWAGK